MKNEYLSNIRNAIDDAYEKLNIVLYTDKSKKNGLEEINPSQLITENLKYIVEQLNELDGKMVS